MHDARSCGKSAKLPNRSSGNCVHRQSSRVPRAATIFEQVLDLKTAKTIGREIPPNLFTLVNRIIE
jgi:hypothetical protein